MTYPTPAINASETEMIHWHVSKFTDALLGWRISNFKAFGRDMQSVPLAPITLIFGPNSAGKSSALHSLLFAHEAVTTGNLDVHEPQLAEGAVDLGGFSQFTFCQQPDENRIALEFDLKPDLLNALFKRVLGAQTAVHATRVKLGLVLSLVPENSEDADAGQPTLLRLDVLLDDRSFCSAGRDDWSSLAFRTLDLDHPFFTSLRDYYAEMLRPQTAHPSLAQARAIALFGDVLKRTVLFGGLLPTDGILATEEPSEGTLESEPFTDADGLTDEEHRSDFEAEETENRIAVGHTIFSEDDPDHQVVSILMPQFATLLGEIVRDACTPLRANLGVLTYLGPLRSFPARDFTLTHRRDPLWNAGGGAAWDILARDEEVRTKVNAWFSSSFLQTPYQFVLTDLVSGEIVASAIESEFADIVNEKSREQDALRESPGAGADEGFHFPYDAWDSDALGKRLSTKTLERARGSRRTELRMIDKRTGARVSHRDVGVGLSQILPILVRALSAKGGLHLIEQPVFIGSALGQNQSRYILETHSENLILRILRRIRETSLGKAPANCRITCNDVVLLFVEPTKKGAEVRRIRIDEHGRLKDRVPGGFFEENFGEMFA